ncbi:M15 family metallopeptidase [Ureibacillus aquaedulcis]|uniref:D-alanyl-D-alanine dipeptidase n=1 Tax=Ureibacillus aquaedulcis TaxID=3058421 RepID=A0ABT8GUC8_9BACL|nr:M15 family metallopeptidase [Ureibacillus sp. BA0131]MDN4494501.1 M15 family metallopeptidase [Ureibacillus sp. BA0131]
MQLHPIIRENQEPLLNLTDSHSRIYSRSIYFEQQIPNSLQSIYLRQNAYERLVEALTLLPVEYSFIVYDGYRPIQVQQHLFQLFSEEIKGNHPDFSEEEILEETLKYVAFPSVDPTKTSPHLTGGAIDLTLGDLEGNPLDLGSVFDEMSVKSATRYYEHHPFENEEALKNRRLLYNCMTTVGFTNYSEEWWHFDYGNATWARRVNSGEAKYGAVESKIKAHQLKEYRYYESVY